MSSKLFRKSRLQYNLGLQLFSAEKFIYLTDDAFNVKEKRFNKMFTSFFSFYQELRINPIFMLPNYTVA